MKGLFFRSMENKEKVMIFYMDSKGRVTQRFIRVLKWESQAILAYCYYRKKVRKFKLERILSAGPATRRKGA